MRHILDVRFFAAISIVLLLLRLDSVNELNKRYEHQLEYSRSQYFELQEEYIKVLALNREENSELFCLADNIFFEAGNQSIEGQKAVAAVTLNRVQHERFPNTVCAVVNQRSRGGCQFSWVCEKNKIAPIHHSNYQRSFQVALLILSGEETHRFMENENILWYHADYIKNPYWSKTKNRVGKIGKHIFYSV